MGEEPCVLEEATEAFGLFCGKPLLSLPCDADLAMAVAMCTLRTNLVWMHGLSAL